MHWPVYCISRLHGHINTFAECMEYLMCFFSFRNLLFHGNSLISLLSDIFSSMEPTISFNLFSDTDAAMASFQVLVNTYRQVGRH